MFSCSPLLAAFLAWVIGRAVLAVLFLKVRDPERRARLRKFATYAATVLAVALFSGRLAAGDSPACGSVRGQVA